MYLMEQTMRWYGPHDIVSLRNIRQAGCSGVVTALHHIPVGEIWTVEEINIRKKLVEEAGMTWTVIESLPVSDDIKRQSGNWKEHIENYKVCLRNVAACGLKVITYNFMPILDWVRTNPVFELPNGAKALRFEKAAFTAFDLFLLKRPGAENDYTADEIERSKARLAEMNQEEVETLFKNVMLGLPGSDVPFTPEGLLKELKKYDEINRNQLKLHLFHFLREVVPVAEEHGLKMAIHPDDPPFSILGLPRVMCTEADAQEVLDAAPSPANGLCFCTGSFGSRADNDLVSMIRKFGDHVHFLHLRSTKKDKEGNFFEADHLSGDADMVAIIREALKIMQRRKVSIPMRPDHGHLMLDDLSKSTYPGYSAIGRLKGLAELRGVEAALATSF